MVASTLLTNREILDVGATRSTTVMTIVCNAHNPNKVVIIKRVTSRRISLPFARNTTFLLRPKLNVKATDVDTKFAVTEGRPRYRSVNSKPKSTMVLITPTKPNLSFCCLFLRITLMIFLDQIQRTAFCFIKDSRYILPNNAETLELYATQK